MGSRPDRTEGQGGPIRSGASAPGWRVRIYGSDAEFMCKEDEPVLTAMIRAYVTDIMVGCRRGGCGLCRTRIHQGRFHLEKMSKNHVGIDDKKRGIALACRLFPRSDLTISPDRRDPLNTIIKE